MLCVVCCVLCVVCCVLVVVVVGCCCCSVTCENARMSTSHEDELANPGAKSPESKLPATPAPPALEHSQL